MTNYLSAYINGRIEIEVSSNKKINGILVDYGSDIFVLFDGKEFYYIPTLHVHSLKQYKPNETEIEIQKPDITPIDYQTEVLSCRKILNNAKGTFAEIYITGKQPLYGYITTVLNNYFVFYSPVYKTVFIPINHFKWLIPYQFNQTPYSLTKEHLPVIPTTISIARTFEEQLKKLEGKIVVFDLGDNPNKIGLLKKYNHNIIELVTGREESIHWNLNHLKTVHLSTSN